MEELNNFEICVTVTFIEITERLIEIDLNTLDDTAEGESVISS